MKTEWIFIEAHDVWMFRDAKPFTAGEGFIARSTFPPYPQTVQGAIRSLVIEQSGISHADFRSRADEMLLGKIGAPATTKAGNATLGNFWMKGPYVACRRGEKIRLLVPTPLDVIRRKDNPDGPFVLLRPQPPDFACNVPFDGWQMLVPPDTKEYEPAGGWLRQADFERYLNGQPPKSKHVVKTSDIYELDGRVGLALDYTRRTHRESMFYNIEFARPQRDIGLLVEVPEGLLVESSGFITLGGESRMGRYETVDFALPTNTHKGKIKMVLLTPAYFSGGWQPENGNWSRWVGHEGQLVSMALGRPDLISGWDVVRNQPKPLYHYVPAGSVYYFENATTPTMPFTETVPDASFEGNKLDAGRVGFGAFAVGTWS